MKYIVELIFAITNHGRVVSFSERLLLERKISNRILALTLCFVAIFGLLTYFFDSEVHLIWLVALVLLFSSSLFEALALRAKTGRGYSALNGWSLLFLVSSVLGPLVKKVVSFFL